MPEPAKRLRLELQGVVQGVGFRPYVFALAQQHGLFGFVTNTSAGVLIEVQGPPQAVDAFSKALPQQLPPLAFLLEMRQQPVALDPKACAMRIEPSQKKAPRTALLPPDVAVCPACLAELRSPTDRRYRYPFINCTHCGPRYTIINDVPYDRPKTTMAPFVMCERCQAEYDDPQNRRFHAQPNACPQCGPSLWLALADGSPVPCKDPIAQAATLLQQGQILAVKGLGGFHLAVDACQESAVQRLRDRKHREEKPLAVMCKSLDEARLQALLEPLEEALLTSRHRPIVLVHKRPGASLAPSVAPEQAHFGLMLPYTPIHELLLDDGPRCLVMTSGNLTDEPIAIDNDEALRRLGSVADVFLLHNRDILVRNDDSVLSIIAKHPRFIRRSRGYVPLPVLLANESPSVLAVGAELKNTLCLTRDRLAFMSQHIGDQANVAAFESFVSSVQRFKTLVGTEPERIAVDLHPDYATTQWAETQGLPLVRVQHHHAHIAACLAEHQRPGPAIGIALDGTGLGTDGTIWGGEVLLAHLGGFRRAAHLAPVPLPGGDKAAKEPWRMALSLLVHSFGEAWQEHLPRALQSIPAEKIAAVWEMLRTQTNCPLTSSCGRLFDAIAALCGLCLQASFEAQGAMALEASALMHPQGQAPSRYGFALVPQDGALAIDPAPLMCALVQDLRERVPVSAIALGFHQALVNALVHCCKKLRERTGLELVAISGGAAQNRLLLTGLIEKLSSLGFEVLTHEKVPANDGGLALGQAAVAGLGAQFGSWPENDSPLWW